LIEVNLLPGGAKRAKKGGGAGGFKLKVPQFGMSADRGLLVSGLLVVGLLGAGGYLFTDVRRDREETQVALDEQVQDSIRFADLIARTQLLTARRDSIAQRVGIIQQIDQNRYVWPHVLDEVGRALPDYTWLTELAQVSSEPISVRLTGQAGNNYALTVFMENLEASPFLQNVTLIQSAQEFVGQQTGGAQQQVVQGFQLEVGYVPPPMEFLQTVPLFDGAVETQTQMEAVPQTAAPGRED
jgi:type IV pilus assembly protein PilN